MALNVVRYSDAELDEFKIIIEEKIVKSNQEIEFSKQQLNELQENSTNQSSGDWTDESSVHTGIEMTTNILTRQQQFLRSLELALQRIQNKTYGICSLTGQLIDKERLRLVPHATKSVEAKNARPAIANSQTILNDISPRFVEEELSVRPEDQRVQFQKEFFENN